MAAGRGLASGFKLDAVRRVQAMGTGGKVAPHPSTKALTSPWHSSSWTSQATGDLTKQRLKCFWNLQECDYSSTSTPRPVQARPLRTSEC